MRSRSPSCRFWLLAAAIQVLLLLLVQHCAANEKPLRQDEDRPHVDWNTLFKAFVMMGDGIFGQWTPKNIEKELLLMRENYF